MVTSQVAIDNNVTEAVKLNVKLKVELKTQLIILFKSQKSLLAKALYENFLSSYLTLKPNLYCTDTKTSKCIFNHTICTDQVHFMVLVF